MLTIRDIIPKIKCGYCKIFQSIKINRNKGSYQKKKKKKKKKRNKGQIGRLILKCSSTDASVLRNYIFASLTPKVKKISYVIESCGSLASARFSS